MLPIPIDRRHALGLLVGGALTALAPGAADAGRGWCRVDPIVHVGFPGKRPQRLHIWAALWARNMAEARRLADGPIQVVCFLPPGIPYERLDDRPGFGDGFEVTWQRDDSLVPTNLAIPMRIRVRIPTVGNGGVRAKAWLKALTPGPIGAIPAAYGRSNDWIELLTPGVTGTAASTG